MSCGVQDLTKADIRTEYNEICEACWPVSIVFYFVSRRIKCLEVFLPCQVNVISMTTNC